MSEVDGDRSTTDEIAHQVRRGRRSDLGRALARVGLASRSVVYLSLAVLVLQLAFGSRPDDTDQAGALRELGAQPVGRAVLWLLVLGVTFHVLWHFAEAVGGTAGEHDGVGQRVLAALEGVAYLPIGFTAAVTAAGGSSEQGDNYRSLSATVMRDGPAGRWLVGAVGLVVIGIGAHLALQGPRRSFRDDLDFGGHVRAERTVVALGVVGSTARGVVFVLAGVLVVAAAATDDPDKAGGVDAALVAVADRAFGPYLLVAVAVGLACFAAFALGEAVWRRV